MATHPNLGTMSAPKMILGTPKAVELLEHAIKTSNLYSNAELYAENMSTAHVESFNNTLNIFQHKRISFGDDNYKLRSLLAVLHWNENVNKQSISSSGSPSTHSSPQTFNYVKDIWHKYLIFRA